MLALKQTKILRGFILGTLVMALAFSAQAKPQTLMELTEFKLGAFGGPGVYYTTFLGEDAAMVGGQGALLVNDAVYVGLSGYGVGNDKTNRPYDVVPKGRFEEHMAMGYGGPTIGIILANDRLLHIASDITLGGGGLSYAWKDKDNDFDHHDSGDNWSDQTDEFFVMQPMAHLELNVTDWFRVLGSVGYRYTNGVNLGKYSDDDASGAVAGVTFRFGLYR